jgi:hypothetical protein
MLRKSMPLVRHLAKLQNRGLLTSQFRNYSSTDLKYMMIDSNDTLRSGAEMLSPIVRENLPGGLIEGKRMLNSYGFADYLHFLDTSLLELWI